MIGLQDGTYDTVIIEAVEAPEGGVSLSMAITSGPERGLVVTVRAPSHRGRPVDLLGLPATLTVRKGEPEVTLEG